MVNNTLPKFKHEVNVDVLVRTLLDISDWHKLDKGHAVRVARGALAIGRRLNHGERLNEEKLKWLEIAALLHDFGRVGIRDNTLAKAGELTDGEYGEVKEHTKIGYRYLNNLFPPEVSLTAKHHHEHWDGSGYPKGLIGLETPLFPRIVAIADTWDAITNKRPYHAARTREDGMIEMHKIIEWFDPKLMAIFMELYDEGRI